PFEPRTLSKGALERCVLLVSGEIVEVGVIYFDRAFYDRLAPEDQAVFDDAARKAAAYFNDLAADEQDAALKRTLAEGARLERVSRAPWRDALGGFAQDFVGKLADDTAQNLLDAIETARTEGGA
ncbi:MAG: hypothetical protein AAGB11_19200, partial [Pseudomonadota bacterium]